MEKEKQAPTTKTKLKGSFFNFTDVRPRRKNVLPPAFRLSHGAYSAESTILALAIIEEAAAAAGANIKPAYFHMGRLDGDTADVAGIPSDEKGPAALPVRWLDGGTKASIDMSKLLTVRPFTVPQGTYAVIPIFFEQVDGIGPSVLFRFSQAEFRPIEEGKRKKSKENKESKEQARAAGTDKVAATAQNA